MIDIETWLLSNLWAVIGIWVVLYVADYYLTILGAKLHAEGANQHIEFEASYELTPQFQEDVDLLRMFSPRFLGYVALSSVFIVALWYVGHRWPELRAMFLFAYGGLVFRQLVVLTRHARNITLFHRLKDHTGIEGHLRYAQWLTLEISAVELLLMALLLLAAAVVAGKWTLYGAALVVLMTGLEHRTMSRKKKSEAESENSASTE